MDWPAIDAALAGPRRPRVPFAIDGQAVGSVAAADLDALRDFPRRLDVGAQGVRLLAAAAERSAALAEVNAALRGRGLIRAWRDETYAVVAPASGEVLAASERAAARFWGLLTFGAHANGFVRDAHGAVAAVWIAQRSPLKATDPGLHDNLIGGGVPLGQSARECLLREGFEEAGLAPAQLERAVAGRTLAVRRDVREGFQHEWLSVFDLELLPGELPRNQDGEVAGFELLPLADALALAAGERMTVDASLVMLDFALRERLLPAAQHARLEARAAPLWVAARGG